MKLLLRRACRSLNSFTMIPAGGKQGGCYPSATTALPMKRRATKRTRVLSHLPYSILCIKLGSTNLSQEHTLGTAMACCHLPLATRQDHGYSCTACFFSFEPQTLSLVDEGCCCSDQLVTVKYVYHQTLLGRGHCYYHWSLQSYPLGQYGWA